VDSCKNVIFRDVCKQSFYFFTALFLARLASNFVNSAKMTNRQKKFENINPKKSNLQLVKVLTYYFVGKRLVFSQAELF